jgi:hypothetical protein
MMFILIRAYTPFLWKIYFQGHFLWFVTLRFQMCKVMDLKYCKMKATRSFETSGTFYPATQRHIAEDGFLDYAVVRTPKLARLFLSP